MVLKILSPVFNDGEPLPQKYSCEGSDISPPLEWDVSQLSVPDDGSLVLICDDPDAPGGTWIHWVLFNLPPLKPVVYPKW